MRSMADQSFDRSAIGFLYTVRIGFELIWAEKDAVLLHKGGNRMDATVDKDTLKKALTMQPPKVECVLRARSGEGGTVEQWHMPLLPEGNVHSRVFILKEKPRCQVISTRDTAWKDTAARKALINWADTIE